MCNLGIHSGFSVNVFMDSATFMNKGSINTLCPTCKLMQIGYFNLLTFNFSLLSSQLLFI